MRNSVSDVTDAEILDEAREAMTQAAFDAADEANAAPVSYTHLTLPTIA